MGIVGESRRLAEELGALGSSVFFNDQWVEYADRQNYLLEADAGVSTHHLHVETTFSFRTRILDYLWAGLPMVVTEGDSMAELVERERLGVVVKSNDVDALASAIERVLFDEKFAAEAKSNVQRVAEQFTWEVVLQPLVDFVRDGTHAADKPGGRVSGVSLALGLHGSGARPTHGIRHDMAMTWHHLRNAGPMTVFRKVARRITRR